MSEHSVAEAKNHLSELINRALKGEGVIITRHGQPVVELRPVQSSRRPVMTDVDLEWMRERRAKRTPAKTDTVTLIRQMRDEGWR
ncbi:MAG TPA: type II toxin-antitoxin system prevent-host-death family antitoxin [Stellaceae bacterium]|jgi:prevent-host-death family protein